MQLLTEKEMAEKFKCTRRTIQRYDKIFEPCIVRLGKKVKRYDWDKIDVSKIDKIQKTKEYQFLEITKKYFSQIDRYKRLLKKTNNKEKIKDINDKIDSIKKSIVKKEELIFPAR